MFIRILPAAAYPSGTVKSESPPGKTKPFTEDIMYLQVIKMVIFVENMIL